MTFTRIATFLGWVGLIVGALTVAMVFIAPVEDFGSAFPGRRPGEIIDLAFWIIVSSVCLGLAAEVSRSLKTIAENTTTHEEDEA